jgi:hypothetical protein
VGCGRGILDVEVPNHPPAERYAEVTGLSSDGSVAVGNGTASSGGIGPFRWEQAAALRASAGSTCPWTPGRRR